MVILNKTFNPLIACHNDARSVLIFKIINLAPFLFEFETPGLRTHKALDIRHISFFNGLMVF
jgi:hypothetical protein